MTLVGNFLFTFVKYLFITLLLKRTCRGFEVDIAQDFDMLTDISTEPWALFGSNERRSLTIISVLILKSESLVKVSKFWFLEGMVLMESLNR